MITEYTDSTEFLRLIEDKKIRVAAIKKHLSHQGIILTATNTSCFANDVYTIMFGGQEIEHITHMITSDSNYEKSILVNAQISDSSEDVDILDYFSDRLNILRSSPFPPYSVQQPIKSNNMVTINLAYTRTLPGKNKLIQDETRYIKIIIHKQNSSTVSIDIRQPSSLDTQRSIAFLQKLIDEGEDSLIQLNHININLLSSKNKVQFFDDISAHSFANWRLKTVTGITVKQSEYQDEEAESEIDDDDTTGTLAGISKAVLNGSGLRSNEFVQKSLEQGYYISSMKYRYICTQESGEFIVSISSKDQNLRVDIEKSYSEEDGKLFVLPFPKEQQNEIIRSFQQTANQLYNRLLEEQKKNNQDK